MLALFVAVTLFLALTRGQHPAPADLAVGDCLYIRTASAADATRPIGDPQEVSQVLLAGGAERAGCDASHGHEVSGFLDLAKVHYPFADAQARCRDAFAPYVGRALDGSAFMTFAVVPDAGAQAAGARIGSASWRAPTAPGWTTRRAAAASSQEPPRTGRAISP